MTGGGNELKVGGQKVRSRQSGDEQELAGVGRSLAGGWQEVFRRWAGGGSRWARAWQDVHRR